MNQQKAEGEGKAFRPRHDVVVSFSLDSEILDAINKEVGNSKGRRSEWARTVFREALNL